MRKTLNILGIKVDTFTTIESLGYIAELAEDGRSHYIVTPNPEFIMQSLADDNFRSVVNNADLALPDGTGILWAAKYLTLPMSHSRPLAHFQAYWQWWCTGLSVIIQPQALSDVIPERVTGADMVWELSKLASKRGWSIFLLGSAQGVAKASAERLQWLYPNLLVTGAIAGPPYGSEEQVIEQIKTAKPKFIFLAFPAIEQLRWMNTYINQLDGAIMIGVGGALDFIAGGIALNAPEGAARPAKRAPEWLRKRGLEWLWRYLTQPWRRARIKIATIDFMGKVVKFKLVNPH